MKLTDNAIKVLEKGTLPEMRKGIYVRPRKTCFAE